MTMSGPDARVQIARGARATEALLLEQLTPLVEAGRAQWRLLSKPVRVVVSSRSLRDHVSAVLVRHFGGALAGVQVQTLQSLAREALERMHERVGGGEALLPLLVRRLARAEPALEQALGALHDGFGAVVGSVRDLLDAGCTAELADVLEEALASAELEPAELARCCALVRLSGQAGVQLAGLGIDSRAALLQRACQALQRDPERALPRRALFVHGFADATGVATDLIEALVRHAGARVLIDRPADPADPSQQDLGCAFTERFTERLTGAAGPAGDARPLMAMPELTFLEAPGGEAEIRGVAVRVRALLAAGVRAESIGIVARTLALCATPIRTQLTRLGIPFSAPGGRGGIDAVGRRLQALIEIVERREETPADRWLDAVDLAGVGAPALSRSGVAARSPADLRMALHALGAARVEHVAELDLAARLGDDDRFALPVRHGITLAEDEDGELRARSERRHVPRAALEALIGSARRLRDDLLRAPVSATVSEHLSWLRDFARESLGWREVTPAWRPLADALSKFEEELPPDVRLDRAEVLLLLRDALGERSASPLGGAGAGVQVLDAIQARARTFEHLFVIGLNRDLFPRVVLEDPLLSDSVRRVLVEKGSGVLPDLPLKLRGFDEERYLFAQLLSASPRVTLSWQSVDDDGKERAPSTLVERLRLEPGIGAVERLPTLWSATAATGARPAGEHAVLAGLHGSRVAFARLMPLALAEAVAAGAAPPAFDTAAAARARVAALAMLEPIGAARDTLGPAFGFVGERRPGDERGGALAVTTLEKLARCPWQTFLGRLLHLEPGPDALEALPAVDALLLGKVLHATVEEIVKAVIPPAAIVLEAGALPRARAVPWPGDTALRRLVSAVSERVLLEEGLAFTGLARVLAERVTPLLREVFEYVWRPADGAPSLFGAELSGRLRIRDDQDRLREITFRSDLAQLIDGSARLIDLKSGAPISVHKKESTRRGRLLTSVANGTRLQAVAYACAVEGSGSYLFADPDRSEGQAVCTVAHDDADLSVAFDDATRTLLAGWDRGSFLPRLEMPPGAGSDVPCNTCQVTEACVRGDSGARMRLRRWSVGEAEKAGPAALPLRAARALFELPARHGPSDPAHAADEA